MRGFVKGDIEVPGTSFSCESCHMRSGLGSSEGGVFTPPTTGSKLFQPYEIHFKGLEQKFFPIPARRPAYTRETLAEAIRSGVSPAGRPLNDVMPRYLLDDGDMELLLDYLSSLSAQISPGVTESTLRFATIIAGDVPAQDIENMIAPLVQYVAIKNNQARAYRLPGSSKSRQMSENMLASKELATRTITLSRWVLKGAPETWRSQLERYYRNEPVFALLGGIAAGEWQPIHQFSEDHHLPSLLPQTSLPVVSDVDWYTLYPSKGYFQEGETAARYLNSTIQATAQQPLVQIIRNSPEGKALADGFEKTWQELGQRPVISHYLAPGEHLTAPRLAQLLEMERPAALLLWDGQETTATLAVLADINHRPSRIVVSSRYLGEAFRSLPDAVRDFTYLTYPYVLAQKSVKTTMGTSLIPDDGITSVKLADLPAGNRTLRTKELANSVTQLLTLALMDMRGNYYRDYFLDVLGMQADQPSSVFGRLSFGPGQRYASKGCYIVQMTKGPAPELVRRSEWVIH